MVKNLPFGKALHLRQYGFNHLNEIKAKLGISGVSSIGSLWYKSKEEKGAQIDLIIERKDNIVNLCEAKFYSDCYF